MHFLQVGVGVDISDDLSGKLEDLRAQVGNNDGMHCIARDAVDAILCLMLCTSGEGFVHHRHVVKFVRPELEEYSVGLVVRLLDIMSNATKVGQKPRNLEHFHAERRAMQNENDEGRYPTESKVDGGVPTSSAFAVVSKKAHTLLSDMMDRGAAQGKNTSILPFPSSEMISRIGCSLSWHIHDQTFRAMALALDPIIAMVAPKSEDFNGQEPDRGSPDAQTVYDLMGWVVLRTKQLAQDLQARSSLTERQRRFLELLLVWTPNAQMSRKEAESTPRLSTEKVSARSDKHDALEGVFVTQSIYELGWRLEHTINLALDSGAMKAQGAGEMFGRIESALLYNPFFLRLLRLTLREQSSAEPDLVRLVPPKDVPESIADLLDCDVWVQREPLLDLWGFTLSTFIRMKGKDYCVKENAQRGGKQAENDKMSHRGKVRAGESSTDSKSSGNGGKSTTVDDEKNEAFIKSLEKDGAAIDLILFPGGDVDGHNLPPPAVSTDDEGVDDDKDSLDEAWFASDDDDDHGDVDIDAEAQSVRATAVISPSEPGRTDEQVTTRKSKRRKSNKSE